MTTHRRLALVAVAGIATLGLVGGATTPRTGSGSPHRSDACASAVGRQTGPQASHSPSRISMRPAISSASRQACTRSGRSTR